MKLYDQVIFGEFVDRPNRFIANVITERGMERCHVKNTGRCAELLVRGARVTLSVSGKEERKTRCDLVAVQKGNRYINMDSQAPNRAAREAMERIFPGLTLLRPETVYGASRFDFYLEQGDKRSFVEVKGVTLEKNGAVLFPDAPTARGAKHVRELASCVQNGLGACLLFVVQMRDVEYLSPNWDTDPEFSSALRDARDAGVQIMAYDCLVTPDGMALRRPVEIRL